MVPVLSGTILPAWRLRAFQSGLVPPANNLNLIDEDREPSCIAQHVGHFVSISLRQ